MRRPVASRRVTAADDFVEENWRGSYYELAILLGRRDDPGAEERLVAALQSVSSHPHLQGWYDHPNRAANEQHRLGLGEIEPSRGRFYGHALLPNGRRTVCVVHVIREEGTAAGDWLDVCLPTGALNVAIPEMEYPILAATGRSWREPIDRWFLEITEQLSRVAPFSAAVIGEEVSGHWPLDAGYSDHELSTVLPHAGGVIWHPPTAWDPPPAQDSPRSPPR